VSEPLAREPGLAGGVASAVLAAVDLGSNSFHLLVARETDGHLAVIDKLREPVRLAAGLDERRYLTPDAVERALACLARFGERLRAMAPGSVRAVGTNTLRSARNAETFRRDAERALGHPIEVIAGREEARLVYLGVAHALAGDGRRRLVIDIGGGSTEFIVGEAFETVHRESLHMGCVSMSLGYFGDGLVDRVRMQRAEMAARVELEPIERRFRTAGWESAVGSSGTIRAVAAICQAAGWCEDGVTRAGLRKLRRALIRAGSIEAVSLRELKSDRRPVLAGGVAVLSAVFDALDMERLEVSDMALREGLLYDLIGRIRHEDIRGRTVRKVAERFDIDREQAARVRASALALVAQVRVPWGLDGEDADMLAWAAGLHEIGISVSHSTYHKHGWYLLANADLAGFSRQEQALLASLVRGHRRKFPEAVFCEIQGEKATLARRLCVLLRLAVVLHRGRSDLRLPRVTLEAHESVVHLRFPSGWLERHPLTAADLSHEASYLSAVGFTLQFA
jgi:exopolyphosphatase/guanosine-5'-triphosphate,3'-diphosphate pyrophosphatase